MAHRTLYLVRHGQYDPADQSNPLGAGLSAVGREQAIRTAELLAQVPVTTIYSSRLTRAVETAREIAARQNDARQNAARQDATRQAGVKIIELEHLKEISPPLPYLALKLMKDAPVRRIARNLKHIERVYRQLFEPAGQQDEYEVVVCHGNVIRYFACRVLQVPPSTWMSMEIYNASITSVEIDRYGNSILLSYNETGHLSESLKTENLTPMGAGLKYQPPPAAETNDNPPSAGRNRKTKKPE